MSPGLWDWGYCEESGLVVLEKWEAELGRFVSPNGENETRKVDYMEVGDR